MLLDESVRDHWFEILRPLGAFFVGVSCDLNELERRERERGNRPGLARWSTQRVHSGVRYDMTVETTSKTPMRCAEEIVNEIKARRAQN
jgi:chloramphenicol 3-O phosphotransferase